MTVEAACNKVSVVSMVSVDGSLGCADGQRFTGALLNELRLKLRETEQTRMWSAVHGRSLAWACWLPAPWLSKKELMKSR